MGIDDFMPAIFWTRYFISEQGYNIKDNCLHQDKNSSILLQNNGKALSSKITKHINIRYLFVTSRVKSGKVSVVWCPTEYLIGNYMTKPLQGAMFRKLIDQIKGVIPAADPVPVKVKVEQSIKA